MKAIDKLFEVFSGSENEEWRPLLGTVSPEVLTEQQVWDTACEEGRVDCLCVVPFLEGKSWRDWLRLVLKWWIERDYCAEKWVYEGIDRVKRGQRDIYLFRFLFRHTLGKHWELHTIIGVIYYLFIPSVEWREAHDKFVYRGGDEGYASDVRIQMSIAAVCWLLGKNEVEELLASAECEP